MLEQRKRCIVSRAVWYFRSPKCNYLLYDWMILPLGSHWLDSRHTPINRAYIHKSRDDLVVIMMWSKQRYLRKIVGSGLRVPSLLSEFDTLPP